MTIAPTSLNTGHPRHRRQLLVIAGLALITLAVVLLVRHDVTVSSGSKTIVGSGIPAAQTRIVPRFEAVELAGSNEVSVRVGRPQSVVVHADDNLLSHVTTRVSAGNLVIGNSPGSFRTNSTLRVAITIPSLEALTLSGSGALAAVGIRTPQLTVELAGSGSVLAEGMASRLDISVAGSGDAQLEGLVARDVRASVGGSGRIFLTAIRSLDASVPGSGSIVYRGHPESVTTRVTGSGAVTPV